MYLIYDSVNLPTFLKIAMAIFSLLHFHVNFAINLSIYTHKTARIFNDAVMILQTNEGRDDMLTMLSLPTQQ